MAENRLGSQWYVDHIGYEVHLTWGERDMTVVWTCEIYHVFNGLMLLGVL